MLEMLLASAAVAVLGGTLAVSMIGSLDGLSTITAQALLQTQLNQVSDRIVQDTKQARQALATWNQFSMDAEGGGSNGDAYWILQVPSINAAGDTINASHLNHQDYIIYHYENASDRLRRIVFTPQSSGSARPYNYPTGQIIATGVQSIEFRIPPPLSTQTEMLTKMVDIWITCSTVQRGRTYELSMTKQAVYRHSLTP